MRQMPLKHHRTVVTWGYLQPEIAIVDEKDLKAPETFGHRCLFSLAGWKCFPGGSIDECGVMVKTEESLAEQPERPLSDPLNQWLSQRFVTYGANSTLSEVAQVKLQLESTDPRLVAQATKVAAYTFTVGLNST